MNKNEKIQLDDITFDDVIGDGIDPIISEPVKDEVISDELEKDIEDKKEEEVKEDKPFQKDSSEETVEKVQVKEEEEEEEIEVDEEKKEPTVVLEVLEKLGFETDGVDYADTAEGLANLTEDVANQLAEEKMEGMLEKFPLVKDHLQYVLNGGESQQFMQAYDPALDYNTMEVSENDIRSQKALLGDYFTVKGHDKEFIKELLEDYEDSGKLHGKAMQAREALAKVQGVQREQLLIKQQESVAAQQKQITEYWEGVADTLENGNDFSGLSIPEREKGKFYSYLSAPVNKEGHTQRDLDHGKAPMETKLAIDYLMYKGFNLEQIINTKAKTKATKSLREKIARNEDKVKSARGKTRKRSQAVDFEDLDLSNL
jgi:hypothetical protein